MTPERHAELLRLCEAVRHTQNEADLSAGLSEALQEIARLTNDVLVNAIEERDQAEAEIARLTEELDHQHRLSLLKRLDELPTDDEKDGEIDRLTARWEALKGGVDKIRAHWASFHSVAPSAVAQVQTLIASLEREFGLIEESR